jgi:hypothetical protein
MRYLSRAVYNAAMTWDLDSMGENVRITRVIWRNNPFNRGHFKSSVAARGRFVGGGGVPPYSSEQKVLLAMVTRSWVLRSIILYTESSVLRPQGCGTAQKRTARSPSDK